MSYTQKFKEVEISLVAFVKDKISSRYNYNNEFHIWSYSAIKEGYVSKFKEVFPEFINSDVEDKLWFAGQNIAFAVQTYIVMNPNYTLNTLLKFVDTFVCIQLSEFDNWCNLDIPEEELNQLPESTEDNPL